MLTLFPIQFQIFGLSQDIIFQFFSCSLLVLIRHHRLMTLPERKRKLPKKSQWVKANKNLLKKQLSSVWRMVDGLFFKIVNWVSSSWRKLNSKLLKCKVLNLQSDQIKISDFGLLANLINNSLLPCFKRLLK